MKAFGELDVLFARMCVLLDDSLPAKVVVQPGQETMYVLLNARNLYDASSGLL
jgi:hypothetical protein